MSVRPENESPHVPEALQTSAHVGLKTVLKISTEKSVPFHEIGGRNVTEHDSAINLQPFQYRYLDASNVGL